jgi:hypothetical protein
MAPYTRNAPYCTRQGRAVSGANPQRFYPPSPGPDSFTGATIAINTRDSHAQSRSVLVFDSTCIHASNQHQDQLPRQTIALHSMGPCTSHRAALPRRRPSGLDVGCSGERTRQTVGRAGTHTLPDTVRGQSAHAQHGTRAQAAGPHPGLQTTGTRAAVHSFSTRRQAPGTPPLCFSWSSRP